MSISCATFFFTDQLNTSVHSCATFFFTDQLNTSVHATMKVTPFELVFGQPPRATFFPGVTGSVMEEDMQDLIEGILITMLFPIV